MVARAGQEVLELALESLDLKICTFPRSPDLLRDRLPLVPHLLLLHAEHAVLGLEVAIGVDEELLADDVGHLLVVLLDHGEGERDDPAAVAAGNLAIVARLPGPPELLALEVLLELRRNGRGR